MSINNNCTSLLKELQKKVNNIASEYNFNYAIIDNFVEFKNNDVLIHLYFDSLEITILKNNNAVCIYDLTKINKTLEKFIELQKIIKNYKLEKENELRGDFNL